MSHLHLLLLQDNHYRPKGKDTCYPCECFSLGSESRTCDPVTGQCPCKGGVIGRQCNSCDNPFAEVTSSGCEGKYIWITFIKGLIGFMWGWLEATKADLRRAGEHLAIYCVHSQVATMSSENRFKCQIETNSVTLICQTRCRDDFTPLSSPGQAEEALLGSGLTWQQSKSLTIQ